MWIPATNRYTYLIDAGKKIMTASTTDAQAKELISLAELNKALGTDLKNFFTLTWNDASSFIISNNQKYYTYNCSSKLGKQVFDLPEKAENATFTSSYSAVAFTEQNNLYVLNDQQEKTALTNETNSNIVSGQFIARNEFGIKGGIFWSPMAKYIAFYQKDQSEVADYPILDITETPGKLENIKYPMAGQKSEKPKVGIYNLQSKKPFLLNLEAMKTII